jgi:hypothetical protein
MTDFSIEFSMLEKMMCLCTDGADTPHYYLIIATLMDWHAKNGDENACPITTNEDSINTYIKAVAEITGAHMSVEYRGENNSQN